mgnify:CR=1 FL=1
MKEDFLVIDHNGMLRILFLKCNTLLKLKEYNNKKNINKILKENNKINTILDGKGNDINIEESETNIEESETNIEEEKEEEIENKIVNTDKNIIFSPRNNNKMVTIELNETKDIVIEVEKNEEELNELNEIEEENNANVKCHNGCKFCVNGCDLICTGFSYICSCFGYYMGKIYRKIKKLF